MKRKLGLLLTLNLLLGVVGTKAQTYYSTHNNPQVGSDYDTTSTSGCTICQFVSPAFAADTSTSTASRIMVQGNPSDEATLFLKLTDTASAGGSSGVAMVRSGTANATVLNSMKVTTYLAGVQQETATGNGLNTYVINAVTGLRAIEFTTTKKYDEVSITLGKLGSGVNWADIYYGYGTAPPALPVELVNFSAEVVSNAVNISWATASEKDNSHFLVQHSTNAKDFKTIDKVQGYGNSINYISYLSTDDSPQEGYNYYRLVQVDYNGDESISKVVVVKFSNTMQSVKTTIYPNPAVNSLTVSFNGTSVNNAEVKVGDMMGNILISNTINSETDKVNLDVSGLPQGTYMLYVFAADGTIIHRQLITKSI